MTYTRESDRHEITRHARNRPETKVTCHRQTLNTHEREIDMTYTKQKRETDLVYSREQT